jgi:uncharacterized protein (DUF433 family)
MSIAAIRGVIHGKTIELELAPKLPDGQRVSVQLEPEATPPEWLDRFVTEPSIAPAKLLIKGTHVPVDDVAALVEEGRSDEELRRRYPDLSADDVTAVREYAKVPAGLRRSFGGWAEDAEELDHYLEWTRQNRKLSRAVIGE